MLTISTTLGGGCSSTTSVFGISCGTASSWTDFLLFCELAVDLLMNPVEFLRALVSKSVLAAVVVGVLRLCLESFEPARGLLRLGLPSHVPWVLDSFLICKAELLPPRLPRWFEDDLGRLHSSAGWTLVPLPPRAQRTTDSI